MKNDSLRSFEDCVGSLYFQDRLETFWQCRHCFDHLLRSDFLTELLSDQLNHCLENDPELFSIHDGVATIKLSNGLVINITLLDFATKKGSLQSIVGHTMLGYCSARPGTSLTVELFRLPAKHNNSIFNRTAPLRWQKEICLESMDVLEIDAGEALFRISEVSGLVALVLLRSNDFLEFSWDYDGESLLPVQATLMNIPTDRLHYITKVLGKLPAPESLSNLERIADHHSHRVRWSAIQAMFELDFETGLRRLTTALDDPHPSIRNAAKKAIGETMHAPSERPVS